ncbi:MAG: TonB-dependent receptor [Bacteroidota bacterium]|nr:TonB-dependent receptor [Bacteroidota bacterium]
MRRIAAFLAIFLSTAMFVRAQSIKGKINGSIKDGSQKNLQAATISLLRAKDSSSIKFSTADKDGNYEFADIPLGKYIVTVTSVGYDKAFSNSFEITESKPEINLGTINMTETAKGLSGVTVTAKKPFIETKIDKTVVNVDASPTSAGSTALEVLEKSPGITVDNDGNISLRGKAGVIVMLDGKPTYLSSADLANLLKNMPASALEQIEIMTNPSSKYDAAGNAGVINIKTKKGKADGFNGSIMVGATVGLYKPQETFYVIPKSQNSFNFNYRKNKFNFFGNYNPNYFRGRGLLTINRKFIDNNGTVTGYSDVFTQFKFGNNNHTLKLGMDYFVDKKNTFGVVVSGFMFNGHPTPVTTTSVSNDNHQTEFSLVSLTQNRIHFKNFSSNFNYRHLFDTTGRELTVDLDYVFYDNTANMLLTTDSYDGAGQQNADPLLLNGHLPSTISIYSVKSDYTHPFKKGGSLEAGIKSSFVKNNSLVDYKRLVSNEWFNDARSNQFIYNENINAAYVNVNKQIKKWSLQGGLRIENTVAKGFQVFNDSTFKRNFTNLFPSAFISYEINKSNSLTVSYSRRITRPNYQDLNPFTFFLDSLSYRIGNPYLLPQFTHSVELSHSYKGKLITTLNYSTTADVISQINKQDPQSKIVFFTPDNVAKFTNMGISITAPVPVTKWWSLNFFTNIYRNHYTGVYNGDPIDIAYTSFMMNMTNSFTVKHGYTFELSGFYRGKGVDQLNIGEPLYQMSLGGQKTVMKGKATVRLNIRDPFAWMKYTGVTRYSNIDVQIHNRFESRQVTATFTYRFGKSTQQNQPRRRNNATQDEQNRVGGAN